MKPDRVRCAGRSYFAQYGQPCRGGTVSVSVGVDLYTGQYEAVELNWSTPGSVPIDVAEIFLLRMKAAMRLAKKLSKFEGLDAADYPILTSRQIVSINKKG